MKLSYRRSIKLFIPLLIIVSLAAAVYAHKETQKRAKVAALKAVAQETAVLEAAKYISTEAYINQFDPAKYMRAGTDFFDAKYSPYRLGKSIDQIDKTFDYVYSHLEQVESRLSKVDRRKALKSIFGKVTSGSVSDHERHVAVLHFLYKAAHHNAFVQPMYSDKEAVYDPLILLELGEMRCGAVARVAADLFDAAGYKVRLVQAIAHTTAEIFYGGEWHLFEADLAGGPPLMVDGRIPSIERLAKNPFLIDQIPSHFETFVARAPRSKGPETRSPTYPSYYFFSKKGFATMDATYYYKTATEEQAARTRWYGWEYYKTTTDRWELSEFEPKYEPDLPEFKDVTVVAERAILEWLPSLDSDGDLIGYRVYVSTSSRGWNYHDIATRGDVKRYFLGGWKPEMYDNLFKEPPSDVALIETTSTRIELPLLESGKPLYVTVMPFDRHGESVGRRLYNQSAELRVSR